MEYIDDSYDSFDELEDYTDSNNKTDYDEYLREYNFLYDAISKTIPNISDEFCTSIIKTTFKKIRGDTINRVAKLSKHLNDYLEYYSFCSKQLEARLLALNYLNVPMKFKKDQKKLSVIDKLLYVDFYLCTLKHDQLIDPLFTTNEFFEDVRKYGIRQAIFNAENQLNSLTRPRSI
jgi:hypothetical protein